MGLLTAFAGAHLPRPNCSISEWAQEKRYLSRESNNAPGPWRNGKTPYLVEIMDEISNIGTEVVTVMAGAQVGKTEVLLNTIGFHMEQEPSSILVLQPTQKPMAERFSKQRLTPMVRDTPCLSALFGDKTWGNSMLEKQYPGGVLFINGANSPSSLASMPMRILLADEVDHYPESAGEEGDPLSLAEARTQTFWNRKRVRTSTPLLEGSSRIAASFSEGDQRYFEVPCPHCDAFQRLRWSNVIFAKDEKGAPDLETVCYECASCRAPIEEIEKRRMLLRGRWVATAPFKGHASFHLSALYSPWLKWREAVEEWHQARGDTERMKKWTNTVLGETWREEAREIDHAPLLSRRESYGVPDDILVIVASADVQDDRIEVLALGYGLNEESWKLEHRIFAGDTTLAAVWDDLRSWLTVAQWTRDDGTKLQLAAIGIDSGHQTKMVYEFCKRTRGRVFCLKGVSGDKAIASPPTQGSRAPVALYTVGVDVAKDVLFARLAHSGPARLHFDAACTEEFFLQLTAEKAVLKKRRGFEYREWQKIRPRNEILDLYVYSLATLYILNPVWPALVKKAEPEAPKPKKPDPPRHPKGWVKNWR